MEWLYKLVMCICAAGMIAALFSGIGFNNSLFRCVGLVISLTLCVFIVSSAIDKNKSGFFDGLEFNIENTDTSKYADGILFNFTNSLEADISKSINEKYPKANARTYAAAQINENYEIEVIHIGITVNDGNTYDILKLVGEKYKIEKNKIHIQQE